MSVKKLLFSQFHSDLQEAAFPSDIIIVQVQWGAAVQYRAVAAEVAVAPAFKSLDDKPFSFLRC